MYFTIDETAYWYEINGKGVPVVLLHGFTGSRLTWKHFISTWKDNLQIITIDLPGHGKTKSDSPRSMEQCCQNLISLFDSLKLEKFHLVGYSMGGRTALSFAMLFPERVQSLILESASPGLTTKEERAGRMEKDEKLAKRIETGGLTAFIDFWEDIPLFQSQKRLPLEVQQAVRAERLSQSEQGLIQSLHYMGTGSQPSYWDCLEYFEKPVLLLTGEHDSKFFKINKSMESRFPNSKLEMIEQAGHAIHVEQPRIFGKIVNGFILSQ